MEKEGSLTPAELRHKIVVEEQMKWEIMFCMREAQKRLDEKKREEEKVIGQLTYKLERKIRQMNRLREEEDYRQQVEERYEARMKMEQEEEEKKRNGILEPEKDVDKKIDVEMIESKEGCVKTTEPKSKKNRKKNKRGANKDSEDVEKDEVDKLNMKSLSV